MPDKAVSDSIDPARENERLAWELSAALADTQGLTQALAKVKSDLEAARAEAAALGRAKDDFLSRMSHEMRTPLNAIIGLVGLALKTQPAPKMTDYLQKVRSASHALLGIVSDLMDYSRIENKSLTLDQAPFYLQDVMARLSHQFAGIAAGKGLGLTLRIAEDVETALTGDPLRLGQVLSHLLDNALKFTEAGEVSVVASAAGAEADQVRIRFVIRDSGIGMLPEQISGLFEVFTQGGDYLSRSHGGTGLGLALCSKLVEMMGGTIFVTSTPGKGSEFSFILRLTRQAPDSAGQRPDRSVFAGKTVLVADASPVQAQITAQKLKSFSCAVTIVDSGEAAVAALAGARETFDLVILDWLLPGEDGIATARRIAKDPRIAPKPPVIMLSTHSSEDAVRRAEKESVAAFLLKPVNQSLLLDTMMDIFAVRENGDEPGAVLPTRPPSLSGTRVLLVEDNPVNQQVAREILSGWGVAVTVAGDGRQALAALDKDSFDAVLMDIQMPVMDGLAATRAIRENPAFSALPVIALTAHALEGDREKGLEAGMNDYATKPIDPDVLHEVLLRWTRGNGRAHQEAGTPAVDAGEAVQPKPETSAKQAPCGEKPYIDRAGALRRLGGNEKLLLSILGEIRADYSRSDLDIAEALAAGDRETARRLAHTVKGVAGNISAAALADAAAELERALKKDLTGNEAELVKDFAAALEATLAEAGRLTGETEAPGASRIPPAQPAPPPALHILLVDDARLNRMVFAKLLGGLGHSVETADNGKQALRLVTAPPKGVPAFDMVLMDIEMPEMDGITATRLIRESLKAAARPACRRDIPIIALTSHDEAKERPRCLAAGMDDCVHKDFDGASLLASIERMYQEKIAPRPGTKEKSRERPRQAPLEPELPECTLGDASPDAAAVLAALADGLARGSLAAEDDLEKLRQLGLPADKAARLEQVAQAMERFDFGAAAKALGELAACMGLTGAGGGS